MKRIIFTLVFLLFSVFAPVSILAQSEYLENGVSGTGFSVVSYWESEDLKSVGFSAAYSLAGILDLGLGMDVSFDQMASYYSQEVSGFILYNVFVLKQDESVPFSFQITGTYGLTNVSSDYLVHNREIKRGWGFTIGARVLRDFMISPAFGIQPGLFFSYRSYRFTIEPEQQAAEVDSPGRVEVEDGILYGALLSIFYRSTGGGPVLATTVEGMMDRNFNLRFGPKINITFPISDR
jgi:hypothetical protein